MLGWGARFQTGLFGYVVGNPLACARGSDWVRSLWTPVAGLVRLGDDLVIMTEAIVVQTGGQGLVEITDQVSAVVSAAGLDEGLCTVFIQHTSSIGPRN